MNLKAHEYMMNVREFLADKPAGASIGEIQQGVKLSNRTTKQVLLDMEKELHIENGFYSLKALKGKTDETKKQAPTADRKSKRTARNVRNDPQSSDNSATNNDSNTSVSTEPSEVKTPDITSEIVIKKKPNKPFTPNPTRGYEVKPGKVKIFLDRKASSHTLTLTVDDLKELVRAVEKSQ